MAKTVSAALQTHLALEATTLTTLWEIRRTDGVIIRLTELDVDVTFENNVFLSSYGFTRSAISNEEGLRPDTVDIESVLNDEAISREDVLQGLYNFADLRIYVINYLAPEDGAIKMKRGYLGEVLLGASDRFQTEMESLVSILDNEVVEKTSPTCRVNVGNPRCGVPIDVDPIARSTSYTVGQFVRVEVSPGMTSEIYGNLIFECTQEGVSGAVQPAYSLTVGTETSDGSATFTAREAWTRHGAVDGAPSDRRTFEISVTEPRAIDDWFNGGRIRFESGPNAGIEREVKDWDGTSTVILFQDFPFVPAAGNVFSISPGCDRFRSTCHLKWAILGSTNFSGGNVVNFQGEPDLPGRDAVLAYPDAQ